MDIEALLARHWQKLLDLRSEYLGYILSTKAADREKLEHAIANIYRLAELEPPRQIIWFDSQIDARLCIAMWIWMLDPYVHSSPQVSNTLSKSDLLSNFRQHLASKDEQLRAKFPTLFSSTEEPELILSQQFEEVFRTQLDPQRSYTDLISILSTAAVVVAKDPIRIALPDRTANTDRLFAFIKDPKAAIDAGVRQALEANLDKHDDGVEQELFGPALSMKLREKMIFPINRELSETIENGVVQRLLGPYEKVKDILQVNRRDWDRIGTRISTISDAGNDEYRSSLARIARRLAVLNCARSSMADAFTAAIHRALDLLGVKPCHTTQPLMDAVTAGGWWWPFKDICFACDNPSELHVDSQFALHNENGMAVRFRDGWGFWALNDVVVSEKIVRKQYSAADIDAVSLDRFLTREIMIRRFGLSRYLRESQAEVIHKDEYGVLYRKTDPDGKKVGIIVTDHTSDSDFSGYSILIPPEITTANEALAWAASRSQL